MVYVHFTCQELFFYILSIYRLNFTSQQIPIWVANTHFPFFEENVLFIAKNIFQIKHRSPTIFPIPVFSFCLSHTFITLVAIDILIFYHSFLFTTQFLWARISRTETAGVTFSQYSPACKKEPADIAVQNFIREQMALFSASMRHSEANSFQLSFAVPALNRLSDKTNFHFLVYNFLHD